MIPKTVAPFQSNVLLKFYIHLHFDDIPGLILCCCFFNCDSLHVRLNSHYEAWSYKEKKNKKLKHTGNLFRKGIQLKDVC